MQALWWTLAGVAGLIAVEETLMHLRGDADISLDTAQVSQRRLYQSKPDVAFLEFELPFVHHGKQQAVIIDVTGRIVPDGDRYAGGTLSVRVNNMLLPREDGYFEGIVVKRKDTCPVGVRIEAHSDKGDAREYLRKIGRIRIELSYKFYCRSPIAVRRQEYVMQTSEWLSMEAAPVPQPIPPQKPKRIPGPEDRVLPVRTHLLRPEDDVVEVIQKYCPSLARPGDIVAIAESALAILQGRLAHVEDIKPRYLARKINRWFLPDSSLSSCYSLEMAFREVGVFRIVLAVAAGALGKLVGRSGDFYRIAGDDIVTIDDATGTLPPYDKCVVMGPKDSARVVQEIKQKTGFEAAVVDANDLRKVQILACSDPGLEKLIHDSLIDNPAGNAGEQTPIVVIRRTLASSLAGAA